jgi:vacuolar-type H+-ATPase subunit I/STV1
MVLFQVSAEREKLKLTKAERETISLLNKGDVNKVSLSGDTITKNVIEQADLTAIARIAERRGGIFNLPHYDDISKERMKAITKSYEELSKKKFEDTEKVAQSGMVPQKKESATAISNLEVKPKDTQSLVAAYRYLQDVDVGARISESEFLIRNPSAKDIDRVKYLLETKYGILKNQGRDEEANRLYENYFNLMKGKKSSGSG